MTSEIFDYMGSLRLYEEGVFGKETYTPRKKNNKNDNGYSLFEDETFGEYFYIRSIDMIFTLPPKENLPTVYKKLYPLLRMRVIFETNTIVFNLNHFLGDTVGVTTMDFSVASLLNDNGIIIPNFGEKEIIEEVLKWKKFSNIKQLLFRRVLYFLRYADTTIYTKDGFPILHAYTEIKCDEYPLSYHFAVNYMPNSPLKVNTSVKFMPGYWKNCSEEFGTLIDMCLLWPDYVSDGSLALFTDQYMFDASLSSTESLFLNIMESEYADILHDDKIVNLRINDPDPINKEERDLIAINFYKFNSYPKHYRYFGHYFHSDSTESVIIYIDKNFSRYIRMPTYFCKKMDMQYTKEEIAVLRRDRVFLFDDDYHNIIHRFCDTINRRTTFNEKEFIAESVNMSNEKIHLFSDVKWMINSANIFLSQTLKHGIGSYNFCTHPDFERNDFLKYPSSYDVLLEGFHASPSIFQSANLTYKELVHTLTHQINVKEWISCDNILSSAFQEVVTKIEISNISFSKETLNYPKEYRDKYFTLINPRTVSGGKNGNDIAWFDTILKDSYFYDNNIYSLNFVDSVKILEYSPTYETFPKELLKRFFMAYTQIEYRRRTLLYKNIDPDKNISSIQLEFLHNNVIALFAEYSKLYTSFDDDTYENYQNFNNHLGFWRRRLREELYLDHKYQSPIYRNEYSGTKNKTILKDIYREIYSRSNAEAEQLFSDSFRVVEDFPTKIEAAMALKNKDKIIEKLIRLKGVTITPLTIICKDSIDGKFIRVVSSKEPEKGFNNFF